MIVLITSMQDFTHPVLILLTKKVKDMLMLLHKTICTEDYEQHNVISQQDRCAVDSTTRLLRPDQIVFTRFRDVVSPTRSNSKPSSSSRETYQLEEEKLCKICNTRDNNVVLLPCAHFCCCMICSATIQKCPLCNRRISEKIKTYVS